MDNRLQALAREAQANPGDELLASRYRGELERLLQVEPESAFALLDEVEGVFAAPLARAELFGKREAPEWRLLPPRSEAGGRAPCGQPRAPRGEALELAWRARGVALWVSSGLVLLETPDHALEGRCAATGALLWSVPSAREDVGGLDEEEERSCVLPWTVSPWGAVEGWAVYEAPFEYRRRGRYHAELGRVTEREVVGRFPTRVKTAVQLVLPRDGSWSSDRREPDRLLERARPGEALCDGDLLPEDWHDLLHQLALDARTRTFGVRWRDAHQDWAMYSVAGGGSLSWSVGPAGWTVTGDDPDPFSEPGGQPRAERCPGPGGGTLARVVSGGCARLELRDPEDVLVRADPLPAELAEAALLGVEGGALLLGRDGPGGTSALIHAYSAADGTLRPWGAGAPLAANLEGRLLVPWSVAGDPERCAQALVSSGRLFVQLGVDELHVYRDPA